LSNNIPQEESQRKTEFSMVSLFSPLNIALLVFIFDQMSKIIILRNLESAIPVIPGFFNIVLVRNMGAAWGMLSDYPFLLTAIAIAALLFLILYFKKLSGNSNINKIALSLLAGGISGNLFDRIIRGSVVDFLDFFWGRYHWPAFNIADSAITISVILLIITSFSNEGKLQENA